MPGIEHRDTPPVEGLQPFHVADLRGFGFGIEVPDEDRRKARLGSSLQSEIAKGRNLTLAYGAVAELPVQVRTGEADFAEGRVQGHRERNPGLAIAGIWKLPLLSLEDRPSGRYHVTEVRLPEAGVLPKEARPGRKVDVVAAARQEFCHLIAALAPQRFLETDQVGIEPLDPGANLREAPVVGTRVVPQVEREDRECQNAITPVSGVNPSKSSGRASGLMGFSPFEKDLEEFQKAY